MTHEEAYIIISEFCFTGYKDNKKPTGELFNAIHELACEVKENDKLKAEIERLNGIISRDMGKHECYVISKSIEVNNLKIEIEQLKSELEQSIRLPLTNADKIRSMSDEELAEFLSETHDEEIGKFLGDIAICNNNVKSIYEWLQSEV